MRHSMADPSPERVESDDVLKRAEVILVSYQSKHHVTALLQSWPADLAITVVDNSQNVDGVADLARARLNLRHRDGGGTGFARAANLGARSTEKEFLLIVNPDSRPTSDDLRALIRGLDADPDAACHAATTIGAKGEIEIGAGGWEPTVWRTFVFAVGLHKLFPTAGLYARPVPGKRLSVDWVSGAVMAMSTEKFRALGGFDETFFVYSEDVAHGRRIREAGLRSVLREDVVVSHDAGTSGGRSTDMLRLRGASFANYVIIHNGTIRAGAMRLLHVVGCLLRAAQRRLRGDAESCDRFLVLAQGVVTRRAYVGGVEVARARFNEMRR